jgi:stearoyl-CoA desaturase (delta-9 desaturase)
MTSTATAEPSIVLPPDADAIVQRALREEGRPPLKGVRTVSPEEIRLQRRIMLAFAVGPLLGVLVAMRLLWGRGMSGLDLGLLLGFYLFTGFGVTVGLHRLFAHRSFEAAAPIRAVLGVAGSLALEGGVVDWVATHRRHHAYSDAYGDPHSPHLFGSKGVRGTVRGLWHAHMGWLFAPSGTVRGRWAPDLERDSVVAAIDRWFLVFAAATFLLPPLVAYAVAGSWRAAFTGFVWGSLVRIFLAHHTTFSINSICHFFGKRPFGTGDESRNTWPLSLISLGESWHNNHHAFPTSARHGLLRGQLDPSWRVIWTLERLGLARRVRLPAPGTVARKWVGGPRPLAR